MPHCTIEYSDNIADKFEPQEFLAKLQPFLVQMTGFPGDAFKSRIICHSNYIVSDGTREQAFIHVEFALLRGRDVALHQKFSKGIFQFIVKEFPKSIAQNNLAVSVEVREMERSTYIKESFGEI